MPVFLANPYLWFALAATIPVVLHLLHNRRPRPLPFAAVRFILKAMEKSRRSRRVTQCLILLLRILLILLLVFAFARPLVRSLRHLPGSHRTVLILLDSSASMNAMLSGQTQFEHAKGIALQLMDTLTKGDKAAVLVPGADNGQGIFPPLSDLQRVRREIGSRTCGHGQMDWQNALQRCLERDEEALQNAEIHIISDFQGTRETWTLPTALREKCEKSNLIFFHTKSGPLEQADAGITQADFSPPALLPNGEIGLTIRTNANPKRVGEIAVRLCDGNGKELRTATAADNGFCSMLYRTDSSTPSEEEGIGFLALSQDGYADNNRLYYSLPKVEGIPALVVCGNSERDGFYMMRALRPAGRGLTALLPTAVDWESFLSMDGADYAMLFLCNPPSLDGIARERIEEALRQKKSVAIFPGEQSHLDISTLRQLTGIETLQCKEESFATANRIALEAGYGGLIQGTSAILPPPWHFMARKMWSYSEGGNPLFASPGRGAFAISAREGRLFLFGGTANRDWTDWPLTPLFLVFTQELARSSIQGSVLPRDAIVGEPIEFAWEGDDLTANFGITYPNGENTLSTCHRNTPAEPFRIPAANQPGFISIRADNLLLRIAVNIPEVERSLVAPSEEELKEGMGDLPLYCAENFEQLRKLCQESGRGIPAWPWLLTAALLLSALELFLANRNSRQNLT